MLFHIASERAVQKVGAHEDRAILGMDTAGRVAAVWHIVIDEESLAGNDTVTLLIDLIDRFSLAGQTDFQLVMPVDRHTLSLKCPEIIVIDDHGKSFCAVFGKLSLGIIYKNFSHESYSPQIKIF